MASKATPPVKRTLQSRLWFNILLMLGSCVLLYFFIFSSLSVITQHGSEMQVPSITGRQVNVAIDVLEKQGFRVEIDSSYDPRFKALTVLNQQPVPGSVVKEGRTLYITVNRAQPPTTAMPPLVNLSFRSATLILNNNRLVLGDTILRPDIARGAVLEQLYKGRPIAAGTQIPQGSRIDLIIGDGLGENEFSVPDVIGMTYAQGRAVLQGSGLYYVPVFESTGTDSASAIIYNQIPSPYNEGAIRNRIRQGDYVDLFIKTDPTPEEMERNRKPPPAVIYEDPPAYSAPQPEKPKAVKPPATLSKPDSVQ